VQLKRGIKMAIIGIDLGTTNSLVSVFKDGKSILIPNEYNEYLTPSIVNVSEGNVYVGRAAKERMITQPENTARQFKRDMGSDHQYILGKKRFKPEDLSALVLRKLKEDAERHLGETVEEAVISVPAYFNDKQRYATKKAGELAGIKVERLVNEPSAAALLSKMSHMEEDGNFMVFDFGGGTLDVSLVECFQNVVNVIAISGDNRLGGCDFDMAIADSFCNENNLTFSDLGKQHQNNLLFQCENIKKKLSEVDSVSETISLFEKEYDYELNREKMVHICNNIFKKIDRIIQRVLMDARMGINDLTEIIIVGGSGKMPVVKQYVRYLLGNEVPIMEEEPDTIVAQGVGVYAGIKERKAEIKDIVLMDICPFSLGVAINGDKNDENHDLVMSTVISRNTPLPVVKSHTYCAGTDYQKFINLEVFQGENYYVKDNLKLGEMKVPIAQRKKDEEWVDVAFAYDINGILLVTAKVHSNGRIHEMVIAGRDNISKAEQKRQVEELAKLKVTREKPENIALIKAALQLFEESAEVDKIIIARLLIAFEKALASNRLQRQEDTRNDLMELLNAHKMYQDSVLENTFDTDWYHTLVR